MQGVIDAFWTGFTFAAKIGGFGVGVVLSAWTIQVVIDFCTWIKRIIQNHRKK